ncbi:GntR family transcriptional regulator [Sphingobium sp. SYK-6]|uniref:GntR family transcriptional regulator n=1 Tax=Sphingobium sp. (strain NBRC 103272 / SYK-6) TaxID=627192 RepID=UPI000686CA66|nr:GntR family transcriptional regulator [Sphingobium sp. SYK-6]
MSPGVTFERIYRELKRQLRDGVLAPGAPVEPAVIGHELGASITPVRDALHRLTGEQLVETPQHNGFRVPRLTEMELRDLYAWNGLVIGVATSRAKVDMVRDIRPPEDAETIAGRTAAMFLRIAAATGSGENLRAVGQLNDRLAPFRRAEQQVLDGLAEELEEMTGLAAAIGRTRLNRALARYHQRRTTETPRILAATLNAHA